LRVYAVKTELVAASGDHLRCIPGALARAMVAAGAAEVHNANGKVKSIRLLASATSCAQLIGPPGEGRAAGVRFTFRKMLPESGSRIWQHHPRCRDYE
jgi:hypothetical protein